MPPANDDFDRIIQNGYANVSTEHLDTNPYGAPATFTTGGPAVKPGLTTRGKAALGISAAVIAGGSLIGYQSYTATATQAELKAQELQLKADALELEKLKVLNATAAVDKQTATEQATARQTSIDACVKDMKSEVGKGYGSPSYREIVEACQAQYPATGTTDDMKAAAATQNADGGAGNSSGGGVNDGVLLGVLALGAVAVFGAKKGMRTTTAT
ncbi:hypothetical protein AB0K62_13765 [Streptomyces halstedii]|uniref:hypothetical protein n=1 Tax=Streptomyces halstedii TaxID=1944 RepID=UPI003460361C